MVYGTPEFDQVLLKIIKSTVVKADGTIDSSKAYRHSCYEECCEHAEEMSWHLYGEEPTSLLERVRPRESDEVKTYRIENYEALTKASADKAINIISKIFNPNLYSIRWPDKSEGSKDLEKYTLEDYPTFNSIVNFTKDIVLRKMLADPNGVLAVKLQVIPENQSQLLEPIIVSYGSSSIYNYDIDHFLIFTETEDDRIKQAKITWFNFEYFDKDRYVEFRCYKTTTDKLVIEELSKYAYNFNEIPVWFLGGMPESEDNGDIIYKSFFSSALPYWNLSVIHESDVLASYIGHIFPQKYEIADPCAYRSPDGGRCNHGFIKYPNGTIGECPECSGSGYRNMSSAYGVYKFEKEKLNEDGPLGIEPVGYINVPVEATKMLEERAERMRQLGMWAINMDVEDKVGSIQSGEAKSIDRAAQYDSIYNISSLVFDTHLTNSFYFINKFRLGPVANSSGQEADKFLPQINKPTEFDVGSAAEAIDNFKIAKASGLDPNFLQIKQIEILSRDLTTNPDLKKFNSLILDLDPLPGLDYLTISQNVSRGFNRQSDAVIHFNIKRFIEDAMTTNKDFVNMPKANQYAILEKMANDFILNNKPVVDRSMINPNG